MATKQRTYSERVPTFHHCRICGRHFLATRADARYCDATCRKAASRMKPQIEELAAQVNRAHSAAERTLFDEVDDRPTPSEIEQALCALDALWPDLRPWIRAMLHRLACKRRSPATPK